MEVVKLSMFFMQFLQGSIFLSCKWLRFWIGSFLKVGVSLEFWRVWFSKTTVFAYVNFGKLRLAEVKSMVLLWNFLQFAVQGGLEKSTVSRLLSSRNRADILTVFCVKKSRLGKKMLVGGEWGLPKIFL